MSEYTGDFSEFEIPQPVTAQAAATAAAMVSQGPGEVSGEALGQWLNDVKDIEEGVTGSGGAHKTRRDARRERRLNQIGGSLAKAHGKLHKGMSRQDAQKVCAQETRVGFVGLLGGGLLAIFFQTLISWAIWRFLDWYFKSE